MLVAVLALMLIAVAGMASAWRWKDEAYRLRHTVEVHELSVVTQKREAEAARKDAASAKAETAMCRRAIDHADNAVANLEEALKRERSGK